MDTLGNIELNKIYCCDCYQKIKEIPDKSIDLIYTDIPYMIVNGGKGAGLLKNKTRNELYEKTIGKFSKDINYQILEEWVRVLKNINIYIWCSKEQIPKLLNYFLNLNCNYEILVWCKTNGTPFCNNTYLPNLEYCLFFQEKGKCRLNDGYELKSKWYISKTNKSDKDLYSHPTIKPLELVKRHILHSTQPNDIVLDCFCGSGTTCVAAKETGRRFIGMEIDKEYHKIAVNRLNGITASGQLSIFTDISQIDNKK